MSNRRVRNAAPGALVLAAAAALQPAWSAAAPASAAELPPPVLAALARAEVPAQAMSVVVQEVDAAQPRLAWQALRPVNPASVFKLVTTIAALDLLGPAYTWPTPVWLNGTLRDGVLDGSLVIQGRGDPRLVLERVWLLLRRVQAAGVREIRGDIVLDRSAFAPDDAAPGDFDGEPHRPYNVRPDALLLSHKSVTYTFTPDAARGVATVSAEPALHGFQVQAEVPLQPGTCDDWRAALKAVPSDPARMRFEGRYIAACGERQWPLAYADPAGFNGRLLRALWTEMGGRLSGQVRDGAAPAGIAPSFEVASPTLSEVIRDINKFSNNLMAQQLFLTLALKPGQPAGAEAAREVLRRWLRERLPEHAGAVTVDNGSGLSRDQRVSVAMLAALLRWAWSSPTMPELIASLPLSGQDGTLRSARSANGRAHLKTGSLRDVAAVAGYVRTADGRRRIVAAVIHHPQAQAARPALDALVQWAADAR